jgi:hypothetical protein
MRAAGEACGKVSLHHFRDFGTQELDAPRVLRLHALKSRPPSRPAALWAKTAGTSVLHISSLITKTVERSPVPFCAMLIARRAEPS